MSRSDILRAGKGACGPEAATRTVTARWPQGNAASAHLLHDVGTAHAVGVSHLLRGHSRAVPIRKIGHRGHRALVVDCLRMLVHPLPVALRVAEAGDPAAIAAPGCDSEPHCSHTAAAGPPPQFGLSWPA